MRAVQQFSKNFTHLSVSHSWKHTGLEMMFHRQCMLAATSRECPSIINFHPRKINGQAGITHGSRNRLSIDLEFASVEISVGRRDACNSSSYWLLI
jgi:hypothetical protein